MSKLSEVFWVAFVTSMAALVLKLASMVYKSKCSKFTMCCIKVVRDVQIEEKEYEIGGHLEDKKHEI